MPAKKQIPARTIQQILADQDRIAELEKKLAEVQERLIAEKHELRKQLAAEKTSVEFWTYEAMRWRSEAEDLRREEAVSRVERDDLRDIEALQDLALRGGVA